jgi:hypothetical protein
MMQMKKAIAILMSLLGAWTMVSGIVDSDLHIWIAILLTLVLCFHLWLNRKPFLHHYKGLGLKWVIIGAGLLVMIATTGLFGFETDIDDKECGTLCQQYED